MTPADWFKAILGAFFGFIFLYSVAFIVLLAGE